MFSWLIELLGCVTRESYNLLNTEYLNQRDLVAHYRAREESLLNELAQERNERKFIQDLLFKKVGIIHENENISEDNESLQPVRTSPRRWSQLKSAMEQDDLNRVRGEVNAQVP